jgi:hypothetical protein
MEGGADLLGRSVAAEQPGTQLVDDHADAAWGDAQLAQLLVAADEGVQPDGVGPADGDDQVAALHGQAGDRVAPQADLVVEQLLVLFQAEAGVQDGEGERRPEQLQQRLPGTGAELGPQLGAGQAGQHPRRARRRRPGCLPEPGRVQLAAAGEAGGPCHPGGVVQEAEGLLHHL